jgi:hypothetical protein
MVILESTSTSFFTNPGACDRVFKAQVEGVMSYVKKHCKSVGEAL